jgi:hypothetical protein
MSKKEICELKSENDELKKRNKYLEMFKQNPIDKD